MALTVLVTGGSGFLAAHVIHAVLNKGYNVKTTVRSEIRGQEVIASHSEHKSKLSYAIVPDIAQKDAFEDALRGVDGVIHVASPMILGAQDFEAQLYQPAINGTLNLLKAVQKANSKISRVVITSSFGSVLDPLQGPRPGYVYTEKDWNPVTKEVVSESGSAVLAYLTSKTLAERAALDFVQDQNPKFTVTTLCPPFIYGPLIHHVSSTQNLNTSVQDIYRLIDGSLKEVPPNAFWSFVDVRDLADVHVLAFEDPAAANQRYLTASSAYSYQQICDIVRARFPELRDQTPVGEPGAPLPDVYQVDTSKALRELGATFRPLEDTIVDMVKSLQELETKGK